jgi:hypothetical protein
MKRFYRLSPIYILHIKVRKLLRTVEMKRFYRLSPKPLIEELNGCDF